MITTYCLTKHLPQPSHVCFSGEKSIYTTKRWVHQSLMEIGLVRLISSPDEFSQLKGLNTQVIGVAFSLSEANIYLEISDTYLVMPFQIEKVPMPIVQFVRAAHPHRLQLLSLCHQQTLRLKRLLPGVKVRTLPLPQVDKGTIPTVEYTSPIKCQIPEFSSSIIDSEAYRHSDRTYLVQNHGGFRPEQEIAKVQWNKKPLHFEFRSGKSFGTTLKGFYPPEHWGCWSLSKAPSIDLPYFLKGEISVALSLIAYGPNIGKIIRVAIGAQIVSIQLGRELQTYHIVFDLKEPESEIFFLDLDVSPVEGATDSRTMAVGICSLAIEEASQQDMSDTLIGLHQPIEGVIYSCIIDSLHSESCYRDLITAFCEAFRDESKANLIIATPESCLDSFTLAAKLATLVDRCQPFKCRVIILTSPLSQGDQKHLIALSTYYLNTQSRQELVIPDCLFAMAGIPLIHPGHSTLLDRTGKLRSLTYSTSKEPYQIPHDDYKCSPNMMLRFDWPALVKTLQQSFQIAHSAPEYQKLSQQSRKLGLSLGASGWLKLNHTLSRAKKRLTMAMTKDSD